MKTIQLPLGYTTTTTPTDALAIALYVNWILGTFPSRPDIGYTSLAFKGAMALMGIGGLFLPGQMRKSLPPTPSTACCRQARCTKA